VALLLDPVNLLALLTLTLLEIVLGIDNVIFIAIAVMMFYSGPVAEFINGHVSVKLLALAFLVLIAVMLILEGVGEPIDRTIVYVAILFAVGVEYLNYRRRRNLERRGGGVIPGQEGV